jgi:ubiquinone/menaquinone biosynthesis C-methylase UbiE
MTNLVGIDINTRMIDYARSQAERAQVSDRVRFQTGDALRILDFRSNSFDLVNQRFGFSFLRTWDWPQLLREYYRICKAGGVIRITESAVPRSNSPALTRLMELFKQAFYNAGHAFDTIPGSIIDRFPDLMRSYGIEQVQTRKQVIAFHVDPVIKRACAHDMHRLYRVALPFLRKWTKLPDDYEEVYQQMVHEVQQPEWEIEQTLLTAWGIAGETTSSWS